MNEGMTAFLPRSVLEATRESLVLISSLALCGACPYKTPTPGRTSTVT